MLFIIFSAFKIADNIIEKIRHGRKKPPGHIFWQNFVGRHETGPMDENGMPESFEIPYMKLLPPLLRGIKQKLLLNYAPILKHM